jgi:multisubunit Na+/H+ antiporter MnhC subunit
VANPARQIWIQEIALAGALDSAYMAEQISLFGIVVGIALLLSGFGFAILAIGGALRNRDSILKLGAKPAKGGATATPAPSA